MYEYFKFRMITKKIWNPLRLFFNIYSVLQKQTVGITSYMGNILVSRKKVS